MFTIATTSGMTASYSITDWLKKNYGDLAWLSSYLSVVDMKNESVTGTIMRRVSPDSSMNVSVDGFISISLNGTNLSFTQIDDIIYAEQQGVSFDPVKSEVEFEDYVESILYNAAEARGEHNELVEPEPVEINEFAFLSSPDEVKSRTTKTIDDVLDHLNKVEMTQSKGVARFSSDNRESEPAEFTHHLEEMFKVEDGLSYKIRQLTVTNSSNGHTITLEEKTPVK